MRFVPVDREDSDTLCDITVNLLNELTELVVSDEEREEVVRNLTSLMTDRAITMKAFGQKLQEKKHAILENEDSLEFLFCNAHFLLGMSAACEKSLGEFEKEKNWKGELGRDQLGSFAMFKRNARDAAACRLIRLACDIFGPRGDGIPGRRSVGVLERATDLTTFSTGQLL
jgi:hypothetical protein